MSEFNRSSNTVPEIAPKTYSGLLDDVVDRYPISDSINSDFFSKAILKNLFFSGDIFINDGYIINHPAARLQIINEDSILRVMLREGFVRVLSRISEKEKFLTYPEEMAASGNHSFEKTVSLPEWPDLKRSIQNISSLLYGRKFVQPWPNLQIHKGFHKIISRIFDKQNANMGLKSAKYINLEHLKEIYESHDPGNKNPRDAFEKAVLHLTTDMENSRHIQIELMNIANQAYHYNFAMCLSHELGEPVVADTSIGDAFDELLKLDESVDLELLEVPLLDIPLSALTRRGGDYSSLLDPSSKVGIDKAIFLIELENIFNPHGGTIANKKQSLIDASNQYRYRLAEHFSRIGISLKPRHFIGDKITSGVTMGFNKVLSSSVNQLPNAVAAGYAGLAIGLLKSPITSKFDEFLIRPLNRRMTDISMTPVGVERDNIWRARARDIRPRFASLAFNKDKLAEHVADIPKMHI